MKAGLEGSLEPGLDAEVVVSQAQCVPEEEHGDEGASCMFLGPIGLTSCRQVYWT